MNGGRALPFCLSRASATGVAACAGGKALASPPRRGPCMPDAVVVAEGSRRRVQLLRLGRRDAVTLTDCARENRDIRPRVLKANVRDDRRHSARTATAALRKRPCRSRC